MKTTKKLILFFLILAINQILTAGIAQSNDRIIDEGWFNISLNNEKIGFEHNILYISSYKGKKCYKAVQYSEGKIQVNDRICKIVTSSVSYFSIDLRPLYQKETAKERDQTTTTEITVTKKDVIIKKRLGKSVTERHLPNDKSYSVSTCGPLLKYRGLRIGNKYSVNVINSEKYSTEEEKIDILKQEPVNIGKNKINAYVAKVDFSSLPGISALIWVDSNGRLLKMKTVTIESVRTERDIAIQFGKVSTYNNRIFVKEKFQPSNEIENMNLLMTFKSDSKNILDNNYYQDVTVSKNALSVKLKNVKASNEQDDKSKIDMTENLNKYLRSTILIQCDDREIKQKAQEIANGETDKLKIINNLCLWIHGNLGKEESNVSIQSAKDALKKGSGDCTEHAVLFCALSRALGIPARQVSGLVFTGDSFGFHAWAEAYVNKWIPVDATIARVGIPACYIALGSDFEGKPDTENSMKLVKMLNNTSINVVSATINERNFIMNNPATYIKIDGNRLNHLLWNITVEKTNKWNFSVCNSNKITLEESGDRKAYIFPLYDLSSKSPNIAYDTLKKYLENDLKEIKFDKQIYGNMLDYNLLQIDFTGKKMNEKIAGNAVFIIKNEKIFLLIMSDRFNRLSTLESDLRDLIQGIGF